MFWIIELWNDKYFRTVGYYDSLETAIWDMVEHPTPGWMITTKGDGWAMGFTPSFERWCIRPIEVATRPALEAYFARKALEETDEGNV